MVFPSPVIIYDKKKHFMVVKKDRKLIFQPRSVSSAPFFSTCSEYLINTLKTIVKPKLLCVQVTRANEAKEEKKNMFVTNLSVVYLTNKQK